MCSSMMPSVTTSPVGTPVCLHMNCAQLFTPCRRWMTWDSLGSGNSLRCAHDLIKSCSAHGVGLAAWHKLHGKGMVLESTENVFRTALRTKPLSAHVCLDVRCT